MSRRPKLKWRVQSALDEFDEIAVTTNKPGGCLLHAEMMDRRSIFVSVGPLRVWARVDDDGVVRITDTEEDLPTLGRPSSPRQSDGGPEKA